MFPDEPLTGEALETQQAAFLRQQEERLHGIRDGSEYLCFIVLNRVPLSLGLVIQQM